MRYLVFLCFILFSLSVFASTHRRLPNGQMAYYGEDFYRKKVTKDLLSKILNESHSINQDAHDTIASGCQTQNPGGCYRHSSVGYDGARKILFGELYIQRDRNGSFVQDVYCSKKFYFRNINDVGSMHTEVNIEHTWPQSRFNGNFDKNVQKSDLHHLFLTDSMANNRRANHEFGDARNFPDELNVEDCSSSKLSEISGHFIFTPPPSHRGNVARSLFYFATRYRLFIKPAEEMILRQWHQMDPVDAEEVRRHEIIAKYQKVRNPFIDFPGLVNQIADF
jgi:deoxyribonuclease I